MDDVPHFHKVLLPRPAVAVRREDQVRFVVESVRHHIKRGSAFLITGIFKLIHVGPQVKLRVVQNLSGTPRIGEPEHRCWQ